MNSNSGSSSSVTTDMAATLPGRGHASRLLGGGLLLLELLRRAGLERPARLDRLAAGREGRDVDGEAAVRQAPEVDGGGEPGTLDDLDLLVVDEDERAHHGLALDLGNADLEGAPARALVRAAAEGPELLDHRLLAARDEDLDLQRVVARHESQRVDHGREGAGLLARLARRRVGPLANHEVHPLGALVLDGHAELVGLAQRDDPAQDPEARRDRVGRRSRRGTRRGLRDDRRDVAATAATTTAAARARGDHRARREHRG